MFSPFLELSYPNIIDGRREVIKNGQGNGRIKGAEQVKGSASFFMPALANTP